jgi:hypothetical protein
VHSTVNVISYADISFSGSSDYDPILIAQSSGLSSCDNQEEFPCFEAASDGWILIDFTETTFIDFFRVLSDDEFDYLVEFEGYSQQIIQNLFGAEW